MSKCHLAGRTVSLGQFWTCMTNTDLKISLYNRVHIRIIPLKFASLILRILELFARKVCEMFVYKHTETMEYVKN